MIEEEFAKFGTVTDVALIKDSKTGLQKGFGFITFESEEEANNALSINGENFHGRPIKVNIAKERKEDGGNRGQGGGRRKW